MIYRLLTISPNYSRISLLVDDLCDDDSTQYEYVTTFLPNDCKLSPLTVEMKVKRDRIGAVTSEIKVKRDNVGAMTFKITVKRNKVAAMTSKLTVVSNNIKHCPDKVKSLAAKTGESGGNILPVSPEIKPMDNKIKTNINII